jgi:hypothetical protein
VPGQRRLGRETVPTIGTTFGAIVLGAGTSGFAGHPPPDPTAGPAPRASHKFPMPSDEE